jgi:hypothetical protein
MPVFKLLIQPRENVTQITGLADGVVRRALYTGSLVMQGYNTI